MSALVPHRSDKFTKLIEAGAMSTATIEAAPAGEAVVAKPLGMRKNGASLMLSYR
jgi:hypothetical protein